MEGIIVSETEIAVEGVIVDHKFRLRPLTEAVVHDYIAKLVAAGGDWPFPPLNIVAHDGKHYCADGALTARCGRKSV